MASVKLFILVLVAVAAIATPSWAQLGSITIAFGNEGVVVGIGAGFTSAAEEASSGFASTAGGLEGSGVHYVKNWLW
jgi:hypothetical protein